MIEFKKDRRGARFEMRDIDFSGRRPKFSEKNPASCLSCHGENPRPIWDSWYLWPGMYNSEQGVMWPTEKKLYASYLATSRNQGRYRHLKEASDSFHLTETALSDYVPFMKNIKLDFVIEDRNSDTIVSEIANNPALQRYRYAILGALSCTTPIGDYLFLGESGRMPRQFDELLAENRKIDLAAFQSRIDRHLKNLGIDYPEGTYAQMFADGKLDHGQSYENDRMARLRFLIEGVGQKMEWSTPMSSAAPNTYESYQLLVALETKLWKRLLDPRSPVDAEIRKHFEEREAKLPVSRVEIQGMFRGPDFAIDLAGVDRTPVCAALKAASLAL